MTDRTNLTTIQTDRGRRICICRTIQASPTDTWKLLTQVQHWPEWGPLLTDVDYSCSKIEEATRGHLQLMNLVWVPFRIDDVEEYYWTWTVYDTTPPADGHRIEPLGDEQCRVIFELPIWAGPYIPVCWWALRSIESSAGRSQQ